MNQLLAFAAVVVMAGMSSGQVLAKNNPFVGTWKHNLEKSKLTEGALAKEEIMTIKMVRGQDQVNIKGTQTNGAPISEEFEFPDKGGAGKFSVGPFDGVSAKFVDSNTREVSDLKGGKEMLHLHWMVSNDGNTLTMTVKGTNFIGKPVSGVAVWDRQ